METTFKVAETLLFTLVGLYVIYIIGCYRKEVRAEKRLRNKIPLMTIVLRHSDLIIREIEGQGWVIETPLARFSIRKSVPRSATDTMRVFDLFANGKIDEIQLLEQFNPTHSNLDLI